MYLVQLLKRKVLNQDEGELRLLSITDPINNPTLQTKTLTIDEIGINVTGLAQLCPTANGVNDWVKFTNGNIQNVVWRNNKLYFAIEDSVTDSGQEPDPAFNRLGIRWFEVATNNWPAVQADPTIVQQGLFDGGRAFKAFSPAGPGIQPSSNVDRPVHHMYPYVMPTASGGIALFFTRHTRWGYPELVWTGRRSADPLGKMRAAVSVMQAGTAGIQNSIHWGEYEGIALDPADENRVWATGQLGRCCPEVPCAPNVPLCASCSAGGLWQANWHTSVGSYVLPAGPARTVTFSRQPDDPGPPTFTLKTMPTDVDNAGYALMSASAPTHNQLYGDDQLLMLEVPKILNLNTVFDHWDKDGSTFSTENRIELTVDADMTLVPVYTFTP
jgi:hypothetical protein